MTTSTSLTPPYPQGIGATWSVPMDTDARDVHFFRDLLAAIQATYAVDIVMICVSVNFDMRMQPPGWLKMPESSTYRVSA